MDDTRVRESIRSAGDSIPAHPLDPVAIRAAAATQRRRRFATPILVAATVIGIAIIAAGAVVAQHNRAPASRHARAMSSGAPTPYFGPGCWAPVQFEAVGGLTRRYQPPVFTSSGRDVRIPIKVTFQGHATVRRLEVFIAPPDFGEGVPAPFGQFGTSRTATLPAPTSADARLTLRARNVPAGSYRVIEHAATVDRTHRTCSITGASQDMGQIATLIVR